MAMFKSRQRLEIQRNDKVKVPKVLFFNSGRNIFLICLVAGTIAFGHVSKERTQSGLVLEFELTVSAIEKALDYFLRNPSIGPAIDDVRFAIALTKSNFKWIFNRFRARSVWNHVIYKKLSIMIEMSDEILKKENRTGIYPLLTQRFSNAVAEDITFMSLQMQHSDYSSIRFDSCPSIRSYLMWGAPSDMEKCIGELLESDCEESDECWFFERNDKIHSGYKTSHRLIYLLAASQLHCERKNAGRFYELKEKKRKLCREMLGEAMNLEHYTEFLAVQDLFLEQMALCGFEGFGEFGRESWRNKVRNWQSEKGCFGHNVVSIECSAIERRLGAAVVKKTDSVVEKCHTHVTAVAVAAMAFHLRVIVNSMFLGEFFF